ncbi:hypothetical protein K505DRAFT_325182 [Melanomma pulvis-pyrius CBS 109.77]|uniref:Uncharacterized protein n=1 Tax=Melanomma pulvis-pyrius CBS 109.77 TaxID=1314802 RepID=A0A6A6XBN6_9PLEO|nr:hypothetical protein K505DRAFT_325182 [Melanomma pulvis-pyrius CBS 109.77]
MDNRTSIPVPPPPTSKELSTALRGLGPDRLQTAASLLDRGADINGLHEFHARNGKNGPIVRRERTTALYDAAKRDDFEAVQFLLSRGADVRARNRTGMAMHYDLFPDHNAIDTLRGLDAMRTSNRRRIVQLAEEKFGVETEEEYVRRRDAFDELSGYYPRHVKKGPVKPKIKRVRSLYKKSGTKRKRAKQDNEDGNAETKKEKRYGLRSRDPELFYV